ncbi:MAG TPA: vitamin K epoxide reductase family protein [Actinospica sp.]|nr:vitamin K epoxide reductase family protein [Actinospica sp.]
MTPRTRTPRTPAAATTSPAAGAASAPVRPSSLPTWAAPATLVTAAAGLAVSVYLTIAHYTQSVTLACPATGVVDCQKVTTSPESMLLGIPVAVLGLAFFAAMTALGLPATWRARAPWLRTARLALSILGVCFVARLVYAELFEIDAICLWCTVVHVLAVALFAITALATAATAAIPDPA